MSAIANRSHVILMDSDKQYCLSVTDVNMTGLQAITVSSLTDSNSTYGRVLRSMFQLQDLNIEVQTSASLTDTYTIRPELKIYFAIDANSTSDESTANSTLIRRVKAVDYSTITNPSYLVFTFDGTATQTKVKAASRYYYNSSSSTFVQDASWSSSHWLKIGEAGVELVTLESGASTFMIADATELIDFANNPGEAFNPASIDWQTNSFASWPVNPSTNESDVTALSISHLSAPDGLAYKDIDENYRSQFGTSDEARAVSSAYLDQIEAALNDGNESLRYDKSLYMTIRDNMLSHTFAAVDEENAVLGERTVPFVYFTNAEDDEGKYHPFMVVGAHNGTGGPNFLIDVARPPGDGSSNDYGAQSVTRNAVLSSSLFKIPLKDYGLVTALTDNDLSELNSLAKDAGSLPSSYDVYNYSSISVNGIAVDGVKIYPSINNTLVFAQMNAEITSTGVHVGRGMGLHYHADGHSFSGNGINLYNIQDYDGHSHPPIIGFSLDGLALYGKYETQYSSMDGAAIALDDFGSHSHGDYGQHYHSHEKIVTNEWNGESYEFTEHFMLVGAYKGSINDIPGFQNGGTNQLKDSELGKYVGLKDTYVNTSFDISTPAVTYMLSASTTSGGTVIGGGTFNAGATATLNANASSGYVFSGWNGDVNSTNNPLSITIDSNLSLVANFSPEISNPVFTYQVITGTSMGGVATGGGIYNSGATITLEANATSGYVFSGWDGDVNSTLNPLSIIADSNKTVTPVFVTVEAYTTSVKSEGYAQGYAQGKVSGINLVQSNPIDYDLVTKADYENAIEPSSSVDSNSTPYTIDWFYQPNRGWMFTNDQTFPYFYDNNTTDWLYFENGTEKPRYYEYKSKAWIIFE